MNLNLTSQSASFALNLTRAINVLDATTKVAGFEQMTYLGSMGSDVVRGGGLADFISGYSGNDIIHGGGGDYLSDGEGDDMVFGDAGNDSLSRTGLGTDVFDGGTGYDTFTFTTYHGSAQLDLLDGRNNGGQAVGLTLRNIEKTLGTFQDDDLRGGNGNDHFEGGFADDVLMGRNGNDTLNGGDDRLTGGAGRDQFVFDYAARGGVGDVITDFTHGTDTLAIQGYFTPQDFRLVTGPNPTAQALGAAFLCETDNGRFWFDADGSSENSQAVLVVILQGVTNLSVNDFTFL